MLETLKNLNWANIGIKIELLTKSQSGLVQAEPLYYHTGDYQIAARRMASASLLALRVSSGKGCPAASIPAPPKGRLSIS